MNTEQPTIDLNATTPERLPAVAPTFRREYCLADLVHANEAVAAAAVAAEDDLDDNDLMGLRIAQQIVADALAGYRDIVADEVMLKRYQAARCEED